MSLKEEIRNMLTYSQKERKDPKIKRQPHSSRGKKKICIPYKMKKGYCRGRETNWKLEKKNHEGFNRQVGKKQGTE